MWLVIDESDVMKFGERIMYCVKFGLEGFCDESVYLVEFGRFFGVVWVVVVLGM